jgi:hypothetical protein
MYRGAIEHPQAQPVRRALRFPNLHFELSGYHVHQGLEEVCNEFGAERVLFALLAGVRR